MIVIQTLTPRGMAMKTEMYRSMNHGKSEYSRPEVMPAHSTVRPRESPTFHRKQFQSPSFSDHNLVLPNAGVMYIMAIANAMEIQPKMPAWTCPCRMGPNDPNSRPWTKSGKANLAALTAPKPVPITNQTID